jgi:hypothetical protein
MHTVNWVMHWVMHTVNWVMHWVMHTVNWGLAAPKIRDAIHMHTQRQRHMHGAHLLTHTNTHANTHANTQTHTNIHANTHRRTSTLTKLSNSSVRTYTCWPQNCMHLHAYFPPHDMHTHTRAHSHTQTHLCMLPSVLLPTVVLVQLVPQDFELGQAQNILSEVTHGTWVLRLCLASIPDTLASHPGSTRHFYLTTHYAHRPQNSFVLPCLYLHTFA